MLHRTLMKPKLAALLVAVAFGACTGALAAPADDLKEAQKLYGQGKLAPSLGFAPPGRALSAHPPKGVPTEAATIHPRVARFVTPAL